MRYEILFTPGPVEVSSETSLALARPLMYHRSSQFGGVVARVREGLQALFETENEVLTLSASGTGAMEASVVNFFSSKEKVAVVCAGKFGERFAEIAKAYGLDVLRIEVPWGEAVNTEDIKKVLKKERLAGLFVQACETSTGVKHPVREIAELVQHTDTLLVVDGVSAVGAFELPMDAWGIDILISGSQKAIAVAPGLSFIAANERAWEKSGRATLPRYYFNLAKERDAERKGQTSFTPAIPLFYALEVRLAEMQTVGLKELLATTARYAAATREALTALGIELFAAKAPAETLTSAKVPDGIDGINFVRYVNESYRIRIAGGQDQLKGKIFRIGHVGNLAPAHVIAAISAVEMGLSHFGFKVDRGIGVCEKVLQGEG